MEMTDIKQWYISNFNLFEESLNGSRETPFHEVRRSAISKFSELGFPTPRHEDWKYTNVTPMLEHKFKLPTETAKVPGEVLRDFAFDKLKENLVVFINGFFSEELSKIDLNSDDIIVSSLRKAMVNHSDLVNKHLGRYASFEDESFTALNTAFTNDGTFIFVPDNKVIEDPIHLINISTGNAELVSYPRNLFIAGENSQVKIIESFHSLSDTTYFNNLVTEVFVGERAIVDHIKLQEESTNAFHISNSQVQQEKGSVYTTVNIDLGGGLVRNNLTILLNDEHCESHLFGFYLGQGTQHIDNHTFIDHAKPHCFSNELYKGILDDKARGVFNGKIIVRPDAQKTNALQSNKTLLLTNDASINAKPQLEIFADDVKCTHGATIGQLDDEAMFYLRARGIGEEMAGAMLRHAFISDVLENIKIEPIREWMDAHIIERFTKSNKS